MGKSGLACEVCGFRQLVSSWDVECCKGLLVSRHAPGHGVYGCGLGMPAAWPAPVPPGPAL